MVKINPLRYEDDRKDDTHPNYKQRATMSLRLKKMEEVTGLSFHPEDAEIASDCSFSFKGSNAQIADNMAKRELAYKYPDYNTNQNAYSREYTDLRVKNFDGLNKITPEVMAKADAQVNSAIAKLDNIIDSSRYISSTKLDIEYNGNYKFKDDVVWSKYQNYIKDNVKTGTAGLMSELGVLPSPERPFA